MKSILLAAVLALQVPVLWTPARTPILKGQSNILDEVYGDGWSLVQLVDGRAITYGEVPRREFWVALIDRSRFTYDPCQRDALRGQQRGTVDHVYAYWLSVINTVVAKGYWASWALKITPHGEVETEGDVPHDTIELWRGLGKGLRELCEGR